MPCIDVSSAPNLALEAVDLKHIEVAISDQPYIGLESSLTLRRVVRERRRRS